MKNLSPKFRLKLVREESEKYNGNFTVKNPDDMFAVLKNTLELNHEPQEVFCVIALDVKNNVIGTFEITRGTTTKSLVSSAEIFKRLLLCNAVGFVIAHNHPSNETYPSSEDINVTQKIKDAGELLNLDLLDHIIVGSDEHTYTSFRNKGLL